MLYAVAQVQPIHITRPLIPLLDSNSLKTGAKTMFSNDLINRIYENNKTEGITLMFVNSCISRMKTDQEITPEYIEECYTKLLPLGKRIFQQMELEDKSRREKDQLSPMKDSVSVPSSNSFGMRRAKN